MMVAITKTKHSTWKDLQVFIASGQRYERYDRGVVICQSNSVESVEVVRLREQDNTQETNERPIAAGLIIYAFAFFQAVGTCMLRGEFSGAAVDLGRPHRRS